jgi:hypothetical protein
MPTWAQILIAGIAALGVATPGVLAFRAASRANRVAAEEKRLAAQLEDRKVDSAAFATAQGIYERGIAEVSRQLQRCQEDLAIERHETRRLRARVTRLEQTLRAAGLAVPNGIE